MFINVFLPLILSLFLFSREFDLFDKGGFLNKGGISCIFPPLAGKSTSSPDRQRWNFSENSTFKGRKNTGVESHVADHLGLYPTNNFDPESPNYLSG